MGDNHNENLLELLRKIPPGSVSTYKFLAAALGMPRSSRFVGRLLNQNKFGYLSGAEYSKLAPCHRIVLSSGSLGGYQFGVEKKKELLKDEGVLIRNNKIVEFKKIIFKFS